MRGSSSSAIPGWLNVAKTKCMLFTNRNVVPPNIKINIENVEYVNSFKYLGVHFDKKLKYQEHLLDALYTKLSSYCGVINRLGEFFSVENAKTYYYAFVYSSISYCITVWGGVLLCSQRGKKLENRQKRVVKKLF